MAVSIKICRLTCINLRRSRDRLIFEMKIIIPRKPSLYWVRAPDPYGMLNAIIYNGLIGFVYMYLSLYTAQYPANSYKQLLYCYHTPCTGLWCCWRWGVDIADSYTYRLKPIVSRNVGNTHEIPCEPILHFERSFWVCAQPTRDDVTL